MLRTGVNPWSCLALLQAVGPERTVLAPHPPRHPSVQPTQTEATRRGERQCGTQQRGAQSPMAPAASAPPCMRAAARTRRLGQRGFPPTPATYGWGCCKGLLYEWGCYKGLRRRRLRRQPPREARGVLLGGVSQQQPAGAVRGSQEANRRASCEPRASQQQSAGAVRRAPGSACAPGCACKCCAGSRPQGMVCRRQGMVAALVCMVGMLGMVGMVCMVRPYPGLPACRCTPRLV
jgi:hypothetical protein